MEEKEENQNWSHPAKLQKSKEFLKKMSAPETQVTLFFFPDRRQQRKCLLVEQEEPEFTGYNFSSYSPD